MGLYEDKFCFSTSSMELKNPDMITGINKVEKNAATGWKTKFIFIQTQINVATIKISNDQNIKFFLLGIETSSKNYC